MSESRAGELLTRSKQVLRRWLPDRNRKLDRYVPDVVYPDDVYLVSYPRSGNTWVRFMLANLICPPHVEVTFQNIMRFVPAVHRDSEFLTIVERPRFIKSHAPMEPRYPRTIYLVRDGRDVYVSLYRFRREKLPSDTTLAQFIQMDEWPGPWGESVASWLDAGLPEDRFLLVRYEELHKQPEQELRRMVAFAGIEATDSEIADAVRRSTFDSMSRIEATAGHPRAERFSGKFVRSGQVGGWQPHFGPRERAAFKSLEHDNAMLVRLGYEMSPDW